MEVSLTPEMERLIQEKVESGEYSSASEMIEVALSLLTEEEQEYRQKTEALLQQLAATMDELERGETPPDPAEQEDAIRREALRGKIQGRD